MRVKAYLTALLSGFGALLVATTALAVDVPEGTDIPLDGTFTVYSIVQGGVCTTNATVDISSQNSGTLTGLNFAGGGVCNDAAVTSLPNSLVRSGNTITAVDLNVSTSVGNCSGDLDGVLTLVNGGNTTRIVYERAYSTLSGGLFGAGCEVEGHLDF